jgi:hypothetical protein
MDFAGGQGQGTVGAEEGAVRKHLVSGAENAQQPTAALGFGLGQHALLSGKVSGVGIIE